MMLVDTHAHLDYVVREGADPDEVMASATEAGVSWLVNPSVSPEKFADVLKMTERFPNVFAAAAVHPTDVQDVAEETWLAEVKQML